MITDPNAKRLSKTLEKKLRGRSLNMKIAHNTTGKYFIPAPKAITRAARKGNLFLKSQQGRRIKSAAIVSSDPQKIAKSIEKGFNEKMSAERKGESLAGINKAEADLELVVVKLSSFFS